LILFQACEHRKVVVVKTQTLRVDSLDQILDLGDSLVRPLLYTNVTGLEKMPMPAGKMKFVSALLPAILVAKHDIEIARLKIQDLKTRESWEHNDSVFFLNTLHQYNARSMDDLLQRMGSLPNSLVLAQAAVETGWGTSRFFVQANNVFGVWSMNEKDMRMAAVHTRKNKTIYVRAYPDIAESVAHYFQILSRAPAYRKLRVARTETLDPIALLPHLSRYSEQRSAYTNLLEDVIRQNNLTRYDHFRIDPQYLAEEVW
jgi:Bax protein